MSRQEKHPFTRTSFMWLSAAFILYAVIFYFSSRNGSQSSLQSQKVIDLFHLQDTLTMTFLIRKFAHFSIYALLGICVYEFFLSMNYSSKASLYLAVLFCFLLASADEWHQSFVPGRSGELRDVLIDTCGSALGTSLLRVFHRHQTVR